MEYKENADVINADGEKIGKIDRVVLDPKTKEVSHLVIKKGLIFKREKVLPVEQIESAMEDRVSLREGAGDPDSLSDFEEKHHILSHSRPGYAPQFFWYYPGPGMRWWGPGAYPGYPPPPYVTRVERNIPGETKPLEEGAEVVSSDDEKVGEVNKIYTEDSENRITHLLISKGLISKEKKLIPTHWIDKVFETEVRLRVRKDIVEGLPDHSTPD
jgi:uncharacterized protein YrrD